MSKGTIVRAMMDMRYNRQQALLIYFKVMNPNSFTRIRKEARDLCGRIRLKLIENGTTLHSKIYISQENYTLLCSEGKLWPIESLFDDYKVIPLEDIGDEIYVTSKRL